MIKGLPIAAGVLLCAARLAHAGQAGIGSMPIASVADLAAAAGIHRVDASTLPLDIVRLAFFVIATGLTIQMMSRMSHQQMTIIDLPMNIVYGVCAVGFAAAALRSVQVGIENWRRGYSVLERPDYGIEETIK